MKVLFDTNILLDVLLDREPYSNKAAVLLSKVERSEMVGFICATTVTTIHYLITKALGQKDVLRHIQTLMSIFIIAPVNRIVLDKACSSDFKDFEDAVLHEAALLAGAEYIVTRNNIDFKKAKLPVFSPEELLNMFEIFRK